MSPRTEFHIFIPDSLFIITIHNTNLQLHALAFSHTEVRMSDPGVCVCVCVCGTIWACRTVKPQEFVNRYQQRGSLKFDLESQTATSKMNGTA